MKKLMIFVFGLFFATSLWAVPDGYQVITPDDTITFPTTLQGYTLDIMGGDYFTMTITGRNGNPDYYRHRVASSNVVALNRVYTAFVYSSQMGSTVSDQGINFASSPSDGNSYIQIRQTNLFTTLAEAQAYFTEHPTPILYKKTAPTDNEYVAVRNLTTGELGYYCESGTNAGSFVPVFGMTTSTPVSRCPVGQVEQTYTSATGTVTQNGTPTPDAPVEPVFYKQGQMILRKIDDTYKDTYDAVTGKITRRVKVLELDGTENWFYSSRGNYYLGYMYNLEVSDMYTEASSVKSNRASPYSTHFTRNTNWINSDVSDRLNKIQAYKPTSVAARLGLGYTNVSEANISAFKQWLAAQKSAGTPVIVYYPLAEANWYTEDWPAEQCESSSPIKIATTKYNNTAFQPVLTALSNAVDTIKTVVANTINQATAVSNLQTGKQQRPNPTDTNGTCPNYKQCLLVEDESGTPHWYVITDPFRDLFSPVIANNIAATGTSNLIDGYTQVEYIESTGTQYIDTGVTTSNDIKGEIRGKFLSVDTTPAHLLSARKGTQGYNTLIAWNNNNGGGYFTQFAGGAGYTRVVMPKDTNIHVLQAIVTPTSTTTSVDSSTDTMSVENIGQSLSLYINARNVDGTSVADVATYRYYYVKIWKSGTLVRDMVPVLNNVTGKYGMYDKVHNVFYGDESGLATDFSHGNAVANDADVPAATSWSITFGANDTYGYGRSIVYGTAKCNATSGSANDVATATQIAAANWTATGSNCWCYAERVNETSSGSTGTSANRWVYLTVPSGETCAANCVENCADAVASGAAADKPFRQALTGL